jgi:hypothetical protein
MMIATAVARPACAGLLAAGFLVGGFLALVLAAPSPAQAQQPSANAIALAREIIIVKGGNNIYDPVIPQMIERAKSIFLQSNPMLGKDLNEVAAKLRAELTPRTADLLNDGARLYAAKFTEQELKDVLAFYKSPLGRKVITQEPIILDESAARMDEWGNKFAEEVIAKFRAEMRRRGHEI